MNTMLKRATISLGLLLVGANLLAEPLAEFDAIVSRCREAFDGRPTTEVAYAEPAQSWVKRWYAPAEIAFRVRPTGSAVSPFVGQIEITEVASAKQADDEDTVRAMDVSPEVNVMRAVRRINFAFQDNGWTVLGGASLVEVKPSASHKFSPAGSTRLSREAVLNFKGPVATCAASY